MNLKVSFIYLLQLSFIIILSKFKQWFTFVIISFEHSKFVSSLSSSNNNFVQSLISLQSETWELILGHIYIFSELEAYPLYMTSIVSSNIIPIIFLSINFIWIDSNSSFALFIN